MCTVNPIKADVFTMVNTTFFSIWQQPQPPLTYHFVMTDDDSLYKYIEHCACAFIFIFSSNIINIKSA